jgi:hypothetical protein
MEEAFGITFELVRHEVRCFTLENGQVKVATRVVETWPTKEEMGSAEWHVPIYVCGRCGKEVPNAYVCHAFLCKG